MKNEGVGIDELVSPIARLEQKRPPSSPLKSNEVLATSSTRYNRPPRLRWDTFSSSVHKSSLLRALSLATKISLRITATACKYILAVSKSVMPSHMKTAAMMKTRCVVQTLPLEHCSWERMCRVACHSPSPTRTFPAYGVYSHAMRARFRPRS